MIARPIRQGRCQAGQRAVAVGVVPRTNHAVAGCLRADLA